MFLKFTTHAVLNPNKHNSPPPSLSTLYQLPSILNGAAGLASPAETITDIGVTLRGAKGWIKIFYEEGKQEYNK